MAEIDVSKLGGATAAVNDFSEAIQSLAAFTETEFGKMTKKINLFGTNVAKRIERCSAAVSSFGDSFKNIGSGMGAGMGEVVSGAENVSKRIESLGTSASEMGKGLDGIGNGIGGIGGGIAEVGKGLNAVGGGFTDAASGLTDLGSSLPTAATGFMSMCTAIANVTKYIPQIIVFGGALLGLAAMSGGLDIVGLSILNVGKGMLAMAESLVVASNGLNMLGTALPIVGAGFMGMLVALAPIMDYVPQLLVFTATMVVFSLLGEGLLLAGSGLVAIAQGFAAMGEALPVVSAGMMALIQNLMDTQLNIGGIITFVLLAATMFVMALAIESINKHLGPMVKSMGELQNLFGIGLVVSIGIFAIMMLLLSLTMGKVASGVDKVTAALKKQCEQLRTLIPLQTISAILSNPIVGGITVAAATAAGLVMKAVLPQLATGGIATGATVAMIGEGRYPEAVVPLGNSPQFAEMKSDIANTVLQGIAAMSGMTRGNSPIELTLNLDGERFARTVIPAIDRENRRKGYTLQLKGV